MSGPWDFRFLASGFDSLDLGLYVDWRAVWDDLFDRLNVAKESARHTEGTVWKHPETGHFLVRPSGTASGYFFHLKTPHYDIFLAARSEATDTPNVYISIGARELWAHGPRGCADRMSLLIDKLGGLVERIQVSRCDLAADFWVEPGLTFEFLQSHRVSRSRKIAPNLVDDRLETYYVGRGRGVIQARIYDKEAELKARPEKAWMLEVWGRENAEGIWRVEFQVRRARLREYRINSIADLEAKAGALWQYLTGEWLSLRLPDKPHTKRRTVHPWWDHVQRCADLFGPAVTLERQIKREELASPQWYVSHVSGCIPGYAASKGYASLPDALVNLFNDVEDYWESPERDWDNEFKKRRIHADRPIVEVEDDDIPF